MKKVSLTVLASLILLGVAAYEYPRPKRSEIYLSTWYVKQYDRGIFTPEFDYKIYEAKCKEEDVPCGSIMQLVGTCVPDAPLPQNDHTYMSFYPINNTLTYFYQSAKVDTLEVVSIKPKRDIGADFPKNSGCRP